MLILQESCADYTGSYVVYAPVAISSMNAILNGGDRDCLVLVPSGFAILPDGAQQNGVPVPGLNVIGSGGCMLTVAFKIMVDTPTPSTKATPVNIVGDLIKRTIGRIKTALLIHTTPQPS